MSGPVEGRGQVASGWAWALLLPPGWTYLPTDRAAGRAAVARLLDRKLRTLPRDAIATWRRELEREMDRQLSTAADNGASAVYLLVEPVGGVTVTASLTVATLPFDAESLGEGLTATFGTAGDVLESGLTTAGGQPALRRRRLVVSRLTPGGPRVPSTAVDWVVPLPDGDEALTLTFTTSTVPLFEALVGLFDALADTLVLEPV